MEVIGMVVLGILTVATMVMVYQLGKLHGEREALNYATEIVKEIGEGYKISWTGY